jgi:hypothetical protein
MEHKESREIYEQIFYSDNNTLKQQYINFKIKEKENEAKCVILTMILQPEFKDMVKEKVEEAQSRSKGSLKLLKLASDNVTVSEIKNKIRKMNSDGIKVDLLVLDYVDCISSDKSTNGEEWKGEGSVMRSLESMTGEFEMAIWTATQGNRESISSEVVTGDQMGGSIKKAQIAHVIVSIAKTLEQKEHNLATLTLLKSRIGRDGVIFSNCKFKQTFESIKIYFFNYKKCLSNNIEIKFGQYGALAPA